MLTPKRLGVRWFIARDEIVNLTDDRTPSHRDVAVGRDRPSPADQSLAVYYVQEFDEFQVAHSSASRPQQARSGLSRLGFVKAEPHFISLYNQTPKHCKAFIFCALEIRSHNYRPCNFQKSRQKI